MPHLNQKGAVQFIILLILLIGIAVGIFLITSGNPLKFFSRASNPPITIKDANGRTLPTEENLPVTTSREVQVSLEAPPPP